MSHYIVLVKQVPDVSQITDNAFNPETGNLIRSRLASVINELDAQALAFARRMKTLSGDRDGRIICLSMGPPMAAEVLRYALCRNADSAVLLTDRALGGADTWATANPLAYAVRKIIRDMLGGTDDYYVVAGMQSVDGDTAQVPAQLSQEMKLPCVAYATDVEYENGHFRFTRIITGGSQVVEPLHTPAVITVAKYEYPLYASFAATRLANRTELTQWSADDVRATSMGVAGSKTSVIRVFPPGKTTRRCEQVKSSAGLAAKITEAISASGDGEQGDAADSGYVLPAKRSSVLDRHHEGTGKENEDYRVLTGILTEMSVNSPDEITDEVKEKILAGGNLKLHKKILDDMIDGYRHTAPAYTGDVWVMAEHDEDVINTATFELTGKARELADSLEVKVGVVLVGSGVKSHTGELIAAGADMVYVVEHTVLEQFDASSYCKAVSDLFEKYSPQIFLYGATPQGRVLAPMVSYNVGCGLTADCTGLEIRDNSRKGQIAILMQTRPALGGNVMATICTKDSACQMATARPGVMKRLPADPTRTGQIIEHEVELTDEDLSLKILRTEHAHGKVDFDSEVIISGGRGMQSRQGYENLIESLRRAVHDRFGVNVEKGASRAAVEQDYIERIHQVGQTGTAVGPKLYIAIGISGAIQHMIGVANSQTIIAINSDPNAPIFKQSDYYIVGNAEKILPELTEAIKG